jgi:hypothetical protein
MEERLFIGWGYKLLKVLLFLLIVAGIIFLVKLVISRIPPDLEKHRPQLALLERAYEVRRAELVRRAEDRIKNASNEVLAIQYQQELNADLEQIERRYFADRQSIIDSDYRVLEDHWARELKTISPGGEDATASPLEP